MKFPRIASAIALFSVLSTPARATEPLQPTSKWNVDFGDAHCVAMRSYGSPDKPLTLAFKPSPIGDVMQLAVVRESSRTNTDEYPGSLFIDDAPAIKVSVLAHTVKGGKNRVNSINLPLETFAPVRSATRLRLRSFGETDQAFALSDLAAVSRALDRCVADLRKDWNIADAAKDIGPPVTPRKPLVSYFSSDDYPAVAVRGDVSGTVALVMLINETGKVASCMVTQTSGYASLDAQSCAIITRRASFNPAMVDGKPVRTGATYRIRWQMP